MSNDVHVEVIDNYRIRVQYEVDPLSPRSWDNFGTMVCFHKRYHLGDTHKHDYIPENFDSWFELQERIKDDGGVLIFPLGLYDHGGLSIYMGEKIDKWDSSRVGFIYCTKEDMEREGLDEQAAVSILKKEVDTYDLYLQGEVFVYFIERYDDACTCGECKSWNIVNSCGGYFSLDDAIAAAKEELNYELKEVKVG